MRGRLKSRLSMKQDSRNRVDVRIVRHLRLPVPGNGPAVQFRGTDLSVHVGRDLPVMIRGERPRQLDLDGLFPAPEQPVIWIALIGVYRRPPPKAAQRVCDAALAADGPHVHGASAGLACPAAAIETPEPAEGST
jgi:hypothetical protein